MTLLAKIYAFFESGLHKDKTYKYNSFLRIKAAFSDVKHKMDKFDLLDLLGINFFWMK